MNRIKLRYLYIALTFFIAIMISFIAMRILPEPFPYRINTSDAFHMAKQWELFITPLIIPIAYVLFQMLYKMAKQINDFAKEVIADVSSYLFPLFIIYIHIHFIRESIVEVGIHACDMDIIPMSIGIVGLVFVVGGCIAFVIYKKALHK